MSESFDNPAIPLAGHWPRREPALPSKPDLETEIVGLFDEWHGRILRYALSFGVPAPDAEEVVQDVFVALYRHLAGGRSRESLRGWLFRVAHNLALKRRLLLARRPAGALEEQAVAVQDPAPSAEDQMVFRERQQRLRAAVQALPEADRECLYLRAEGLRYREIAEVMGMSLGSVANSLARSLGRLAALDERQDG